MWSRALSKQVEAGAGGTVDFTQFGPPDWERVYIFGPYTTPKQVAQSMGFEWPQVSQTSIHNGKGAYLVVFVEDGEVTGWFEHPRGQGDLGDIAKRYGYSREEARFVVRLDADQRLVLRRR